MEGGLRRVLGAVRFRDAVTGATVSAGLRVRAEGVRWTANRRGWWVASPAAGGGPAPAEPLPLSVHDGGGRYLARAALLTLPSWEDDGPEAFFRPLEVDLFPAPAAPVAPGWAVIRASVAEDGRPLAGALLRVHRPGDDGALLGSGMTDHRGEALVAVAGIPVTTWREDAGEVLSTEMDASVQVLWEEGAGLPDPDRLTRGGHAVRTAEVTLASGREVTLRL